MKSMVYKQIQKEEARMANSLFIKAVWKPFILLMIPAILLLGVFIYLFNSTTDLLRLSW